MTMFYCDLAYIGQKVPYIYRVGLSKFILPFVGNRHKYVKLRLNLKS